MGGDWGKQRQWQADKQKKRKWLKIKIEISGTWKALAETVMEIKRERGEIKSVLLVTGEAGGMGDAGSETERKEKRENAQYQGKRNIGKGF